MTSFTVLWVFAVILLAVTVGVVALIIRISKSNDDPLKETDLKVGAKESKPVEVFSGSYQANQIKTKKPFDWSKFFLSLGPILVGLGVVGIIFQYWEDYSISIKLSIAIVSLLAIDIAGIILFEWGQHKQRVGFEVIAKSLLILGSFLLGGVLFLIGQALELNDINMQALLGLWFLGVLPFTFLVRNIWQFSVNAFVGLLFIFNYLIFIPGMALSGDLLGFGDNVWFYYAVLLAFVFTNALLAGWLGFKHKDTSKAKPANNLLKYGFQILAYTSVIILTLVAPIRQELVGSFDQEIFNYYAIGVLTLVTFMIVVLYLVANRLKMDLWWLPSLIVLLLGVLGFLDIPEFSLFTGFHLLQLPLFLWLSYNFASKPNVLEYIFFYFTTVIFYLVWASAGKSDLVASVSLLFGSILSFLLTMKYPQHKAYIVYTWLAIGLAAFIKILVLGLSISWGLMLAGLFLMLAGVFLLRKRKSA